MTYHDLYLCLYHVALLTLLITIRNWIYLAKWIVWIIENNHFCFAVEFARQLLRIKFPISTGNNAAFFALQ